MVREVGVKKGDGDLWTVTLPGGHVKEIHGDREELHVEVVEAKDLPQMDVGVDTTDEERAAGMGITCDGFCTVSLGDEHRKTEVVCNTLCPKFGSSFMFILRDVLDERAEIHRQLMEKEREHLRIVVQDWDADGSADFVGSALISLEELRQKDAQGRAQFFDKWLELTNQDGSPARPRPDGSPGRGLLRARVAVRTGKQVEYLDRMNGRAWLEPEKVVEALEALPSNFQRGDQQVLNRVVAAIERRFFKMYPITSEQLQLTLENGIPLGTTLGRGMALAETKEPLGVQLKELVQQQIPIESFGNDDPRDVHFNVMRTHGLARQKAMVALAQLAFVKDESAVRAAMGMIDDDQAEVRVEVIRVLKALAGKGDSRVVHLLVARLEDEVKEVRQEAVSALKMVARVDDQETVLAISSLLDCAREGVRQAALDSLYIVASRGNRQAVTELCARLEAPSQSVRISALAGLRAVASQGDKVGVIEVVNRLQHPVKHVRHFALQALSIVAEVGDLLALSAVGNLMEHPDAFVREVALEAFSMLAQAGQLGSIQVAALRMRAHPLSDCVREGAKFISSSPVGSDSLRASLLGAISREPSAATQAGADGGPVLDTRRRSEDRAVAVQVWTPRLPDLMPVARSSYISAQLPLLPANAAFESIAQAWWAAKHATREGRHRYPFDSTLHFTKQAVTGNPNLPGDSTMQSQTLGPTSSTASMSMLSTHKTARLTGLNRGQSPSNGIEDEANASQLNRMSSDASSHINRIPSKASSSLMAADRLQSEDGLMDLQEALRVLSIGCEGLISGPPDYPFPVYPKFLKAHRTAVQLVPGLQDKWDPHLVLHPRNVRADQFGRRSSEVARALGEYDEDEREVGRELTELQPQIQYNAPRREGLVSFLEAVRQEARRLAQRSGHAADSKLLGRLTVVIESAVNVPAAKLSGKCDPMVALQFGPEKKGRTLVKLGTSSPEWGEDFVLEVREGHMQESGEHLHDGPRDLGGGNWADEGELQVLNQSNGTLGLFADFKITLPLTSTEINPETSKQLLRAFAAAAKRHRRDVEIVKQEQTAQRTRSFLIRIHTGDFMESVTVTERMNEIAVSEMLVHKKLLDEYRGQLVQVLCFTPLQFLLEQSTPVKVTVQRFRLAADAEQVGFVEFPVAPIVATLRKGKPQMTKEFVVRDEDAQTVTNEGEKECLLKMTLKWEDEAFSFFVSGTEDASHRARAMLASQVRQVGMRALQEFTGTNVEAGVVEAGACGEVEVEEVEVAAAQAIGAMGVAQHAARVTGVSFLPSIGNQERVASCSQDGSVKVWAWREEGTVQVRTMHAGRGPVWGITIGPAVGRAGEAPKAGCVLMAANDDNSISVWDPNVLQEADVFYVGSETVGSLVLAQEGRILVTADRGVQPSGALPTKDCGVRAWQVAGMPNLREVTQEQNTRTEHEKLAQALAACRIHANEPASRFRLAFPLIERIIMIGGTSELAMSKLPGPVSNKAKDMAKVALEKMYKEISNASTPDYDPWMRSLAHRVRREIGEGTFFLRSALTPGTRSQQIKIGTIPLTVSVDPFEGSTIAVGSSDGSIRVWQSPDFVLPGVIPLSSRRPGMGPAQADVESQVNFKAHSSGVRGLAFSGERRNVLLSAARTLKVWFLGEQDPTCLASFPSHTSPFSALAVSTLDPTTFCLGTTSGDVLSYQLSLSMSSQEGLEATQVESAGMTSTGSKSSPLHPLGSSTAPLRLGKSNRSPLSRGHNPAASPSSSLGYDSKHKAGASLTTSPEPSMQDSSGAKSRGPSSSALSQQLTASTRRNATRRLHFAPINQVALSPGRAVGAACCEDGTITIFDMLTCKALRRLNGDPESLGRRDGVTAKAVGELLLSRSTGSRRVALRAMPMVCEPGDDSAIAAVTRALDRGGAAVCEVCLDLFEQLIIPGDQQALRRVAGLLLHAEPAVREAGAQAARMVLSDEVEVERVQRMAKLIQDVKGTKAIETPLTITAQMVVELGESMGGMADEEQAKVLRMWDGSEDWSMKIATLVALDAAKDALAGGDLQTLLTMVSHPLEAVRTVARELLGMVAWEGSLVSGEAPSMTVEGLVAALMESCCRDDVAMAAEGCKAVSRVLSGAMARRTVELQPEVLKERVARAAEAKERAEAASALQRRSRAPVRYTGSKYTRK